MQFFFFFGLLLLPLGYQIIFFVQFRNLMAKQDMSELGFSNADVVVTPAKENNKLESPEKK
jgi:hypothetical protein